MAPEMQITTHAYINRIGNFLEWLIYEHYLGTDCEECEAPLMDYADGARLAERPEELLNWLDAGSSGRHAQRGIALAPRRLHR